MPANIWLSSSTASAESNETPSERVASSSAACFLSFLISFLESPIDSNSIDLFFFFSCFSCPAWLVYHRPSCIFSIACHLIPRTYLRLFHHRRQLRMDQQVLVLVEQWLGRMV